MSNKSFNSIEEIEDKIIKYKQYLQENDKPPTMAGLAYFLEVDRKTLYNYSKKDLYFPTIKRYRDWILMNIEETCVDKGNGGTVFLAKNYGYTDKQEIEHSGTQTMNLASVSSEELQRLLNEHIE